MAVALPPANFLSYTQISPLGQHLFAAPDCPPGTALTIDGNCVDPAASCSGQQAVIVDSFQRYVDNGRASYVAASGGQEKALW